MEGQTQGTCLFSENISQFYRHSSLIDFVLLNSSTMSSGSKFELLCLENPLLDIQGQGDEALLKQYGLNANDAILAEEKHMTLYEELIQNRDAKLLAGGAAQNTARGAQVCTRLKMCPLSI